MTTVSLPGTRLDLLGFIPKAGVCCELGCFRGDFSREILRICQPSKLYLVDLFEGEVTSGDSNGENPQTVDMGGMLSVFLQLFPSQPVTICKDCSWKWLERQPDDSLDFCYIDASHEGPQTERELAACRRAVRPGGIIAGHDYAPLFPGVVHAVNEFVKAHDLDITLWTGDRLPSFSIVNHK